MAGPRRTCKRLGIETRVTRDPVYPLELRRGGTKPGFGAVGGATIRDQVIANSPEEAEWLCSTWLELGKRPKKKWSPEVARERFELSDEFDRRVKLAQETYERNKADYEAMMREIISRHGVG